MVKLSDFVDVETNNCTLPEDQSQNILIITFEHPIYSGSLDLIVNFTSNDNQQCSHNLKITFSPYDDSQLTGDAWVDGKGGVDIIDDNTACLTWTTFNMNEQSNVVYTITTNDVKYKISERGINDLVYKETTNELDKRITALEELKHEPPTIDMTEYPTVDEVNEALSNYVLKSNLNENYLNKSQAEEQFVDEDELAFELDKYVLKDELPTVDLTPYALKSYVDKHVDKLYEQIDDLIDSQQNGYTELASDIFRNNNENQKAHENFILKSDIINEYQTKTKIEILGTLINGFSFKNISIDDLKQGFYFSFYDTTDSTITLISNKYSLVSSDGVYIFLSDDEMLRITFTPDSSNTYIMAVINIPANNQRYTKIKIQDWYIGSEAQQYDSINIYCREIIDENFALKSEIEEMKSKITSLTARIEALESKI
ncbi:hypothetical protein M9Y10_031544 [Tritrichomonas musculus]|uniref:BppU N-terminal domain-containing protein n=1 Tax=Tritrichomonas musculus TaxID=1915356 RepID=A0ABR2H0Y2_9EUKA